MNGGAYSPSKFSLVILSIERQVAASMQPVSYMNREAFRSSKW